MPWKWIHACPNLKMLTVEVIKDTEIPLGDYTRDAFIWYRLCQTFLFFHSRVVKPEEGFVVVVWLREVLQVCMRDLESELEFKLMRRNATDASTFITAVSKLLPLLSSCQLRTIILDLVDFTAWTWDDHTPEKWQLVDEALSDFHPSLSAFTVSLPALPYDVVFTPRYECINDFVRALFPKTTARAVVRVLWWKRDRQSACDGQDCPLHKFK